VAGVSLTDRERWNGTWLTATTRAPSAFLVAQAERLPARGCALDLAGGPGHDAMWLAERGLDATLVDVSDVALGRARAEAARRGLRLRVVACDLEEHGPPVGPWDVVTCFNYLQRALFTRWPALLAPGGLLFFSQPTRLNLERHPKPGSRFLLEPGELAALLPSELEVLVLSEGWTDAGRHEARVVAQRRP
jgi:SAM-dependent methyltransferase